MDNPLKLIIGIDYGTTFTGVSYVVSNKSEIEDVNIVQTWPGPSREMDNTWKTPSRIAYGRENDLNDNAWGYQVTPGMKAYSWTKLLLDKKAAKSKFDDPFLSQIAGKGIMELPYGRNAQEVCRNFLTEVKKFVFARIEKELGADFVNITPIECWLTVPAIWSDEAKYATRSAAIGAGFAAREMDSINIIPEPEAAAISALKEDTSASTVNPIYDGDNIMICDCGGGTVDLTTYSIAGTNPLEFDELVVGTGGKCGATYIDRNLHKLMSERFGSSFDNLDPSKRGPGSRFMLSFETIKKDFGSSDNERPKDIGPIRLNSSNPAHYDEDELMVKLSKRDLIGLFDPVVDQVIELVRQQVAEATRQNHVINRIMLVGGFGDSPYLLHKIQAWCKSNGSIRLFVPRHPQAAIVRGAALRGLFGAAPNSKKGRRHYGHPQIKPFRYGIDNEANAINDPFTGRCANNRANWMILKGEDVRPGDTKSTELFYSHQSHQSLQHELDLISCSADEAPDWSDSSNIEKVGSIKIDYSDLDFSTVRSEVVGGVKYWKLDFELKIEFGAKKGVLDFSSWVGGKRCGVATISYGR